MPPVSSFNIVPNVLKPKSSAGESVTWGLVPYGDSGNSRYSFILGVNDVGYGDTATTGFWNGITSMSGWMVYENIGNGSNVNIRQAATNTQVISLANEYGASVTTVYDAVNYLITNNYFVTNYNLPNFMTYGLIGAFLSGWTPSFDASFSSEQNNVYGFTSQDMTQFFQMQNGNANLDVQDAILFDGSQYMTMANTGGIPTGNNTFSISVWFKTTSTSGTLVAWGDQLTNGQYVRLQIVSYSGAGVLQLESGSSAKLTSFTPIDDNGWHCVSVAWDGDVAYMWVDGVAQTPAAFGTLAISNQFTSVGAYYNGSSWAGIYTGVIKFVAINSIIYNIDDAQSLYDNFLPIINSNSNLVLSLDASTYPGSGTTWTDSVGGKVFNLINGPTWSSNNGGYFTFLPSSSQCATSSTSLPSLPDWTIEIWHYYTGNNSSLSPCLITEIWPNGTGNLNYAIGSVQDNNPNLQSAFFNGGWRTTPNGYTLTANNWYYIVGTYDGSTVRLYVNNVLVASQNYSGIAATGGNGIVLMRRWDDPPGGFWGGRLSIVNIYNAALNSTMISQNWNSTKARFGL